MNVVLSIMIILLVLAFIFYFSIDSIADAKIRINKELRKEKVEYLKEKSRIEISQLEEKKRNGLLVNSLQK